MSLIPRWQYMTDESKALVKRGALSLLVVFIAVVVLRALLPWVLLAGVGVHFSKFQTQVARKIL